MSAETPTGQLAIPLVANEPLEEGFAPGSSGVAAPSEWFLQGPAGPAHPARPAHARPDQTLTDEQEQAAARRTGSLLLAAGAGSGKTSVLVERFVRSVLQDGVAPGQILAITFTERAAGELRERIRSRFVELQRREAARDTEAAFLGTFHGFCARLLRAHPLLAALDPDFAILDEALAGRLRLRAFRGALTDFLAHHGTAGVELLAAFGADRVRALVLGVHAQLRSQGEAHPALPVLCAPASLLEDIDAEGARACALLDALLHDFSRGYDALKSLRGSLDFDDLELKAGTLLHEHPHVRAAWSERFQILMVDEFQDTNPRQLAILAALERDNLFTVGDELQSIYGFRHAAVDLFRSRRDELARRGATLALTHNFRSRPALLATVNAIFAPRFGDTHTPLVAGREAAAPASEGAPIELLLTDTRTWNDDPTALVCDGLPAAPRWRQAEARLLALRLCELIHAGDVHAGDVAILLRALGDLPLYQRALEERGLRTLAAVGSFWGHQQVSDLLAFLRALANPLDDVALYATLASPLVGLSSDALAHIARAAQSAGCGPWETLRRSPAELYARLSSEDRERLQRFIPRFVSERSLAPSLPIAELLRRAATGGYHEHLLSLHWGERRLANVHKLLRLARRFEAQEGRDLRGFLDHVAHQQDALAGAEPEAPAGELAPDAVRLMSIHAAKGLEFGVVCLADLGRRPGGALPQLLVDGSRLGLRLARLDGAEAPPTLHYSELAEERRHAEAAEEERILYVAATRARERLLFSGGVDFERLPADRPGAPPIAWLAPALLSDLPAFLHAPTAALLECTVHGAPHVPLRCLLSTPATLGSELRVASPRLASTPAASETQTPFATAPRPFPTPAASEVLTPAPPPSRPGDDHARTHPIPKKPDLGLSYTSLTELERCGYRYYLERLLGLPEDRSALSGGVGLEGRQRGVLVHRLLQSLDFASPRPPSERDIAELARQLGLALLPAERSSIAQLLAVALAAPLAQRLALAPAARREHPFAFALAPHLPLVWGVLDLLVRDPSGACLVIDYKSDRVNPGDDLQALVQRDYSAQRLIYALACLHDGAPSVEVLHWFLERPLEPVGATYTPAHTPELERLLLDRVQRALGAPFAVSRAPHRALCLTCPGRATLCSWSDAETLREFPPAAAPEAP